MSGLRAQQGALMSGIHQRTCQLPRTSSKMSLGVTDGGKKKDRGMLKTFIWRSSFQDGDLVT